MNELVQTTRCKIIQHRIDLISKRELISWADSIILDMSQPPNFILDLSVGDIPIIPESLDSVRNPINASDCAGLLEIVQQRFEENKLDINRIESICYQLALITEGMLSETLHWISDEIHLCNEGYKDLSISLPEIRNILNEITT